MLHNSQKDFLKRHIGPSKEEQAKMLGELNYKSLEDLIKDTVPAKIQLKDGLNIGESNSEYEASYSEFDSPIFKPSFNCIFAGTVSLIKSSRDL